MSTPEGGGRVLKTSATLKLVQHVMSRLLGREDTDCWNTAP